SCFCLPLSSLFLPRPLSAQRLSLIPRSVFMAFFNLDDRSRWRLRSITPVAQSKGLSRSEYGKAAQPRVELPIGSIIGARFFSPHKRATPFNCLSILISSDVQCRSQFPST